MRKPCFLLVSVLFLLCAVPLASQTDFKPLVFDEAEGSYAIYRDTRFGETAYIGIAALGGNNLALRLYLSGSKTEVLVFHTFYTAAGELEPGTITPVRGDLMASDATRRFLPVVYGWMRVWLQSRALFEETPEYEAGEEELLHFEYWIPVLQCRGTVETGVTLVTAGIMQSASDPVFYGYTGEPEILVGPVRQGPVVSLVPGEPVPVLMDGLSIPLDANWQRGGDGVYRIARVTEQDAVISVESLDQADFGNNDTFDLIKLFILYSGGTLLPEGLRIFVFDEYPCLFYRVWDAERKLVTVQYKMFVPRDGTALSVVSLGVLEPIYNGNRAYFDGILF